MSKNGKARISLAFGVLTGLGLVLALVGIARDQRDMAVIAALTGSVGSAVSLLLVGRGGKGSGCCSAPEDGSA